MHRNEYRMYVNENMETRSFNADIMVVYYQEEFACESGSRIWEEYCLAFVFILFTQKNYT